MGSAPTGTPGQEAAAPQAGIGDRARVRATGPPGAGRSPGESRWELGREALGWVRTEADPGSGEGRAGKGDGDGARTLGPEFLPPGEASWAPPALAQKGPLARCFVIYLGNLKGIKSTGKCNSTGEKQTHFLSGWIFVCFCFEKKKKSSNIG